MIRVKINMVYEKKRPKQSIKNSWIALARSIVKIVLFPRNSAKKLLGQARQRAVFKPTTCHFSAHTDTTEHDSLSRSLQS